MLRLIADTLTLIAAILFLFQFRKQKGDFSHILRGTIVIPLVATSIFINIVSRLLSGGLVWDAPFIIHVLLGSGLFLSICATALSGQSIGRGSEAAIPTHVSVHRFYGRVAAVFLVLTFLAAPLLHLMR